MKYIKKEYARKAGYGSRIKLGTVDTGFNHVF
jgi:hypothetical protein